MDRLQAELDLLVMLDAARQNADGPLALMALDPSAALGRLGDRNPYARAGLEPDQNELSLLSGLARLVLRERCTAEAA